MKRVLIVFVLIMCAALASNGYAADNSPLLPKQFAGWTKSTSNTSTDPSAADPAESALLREAGFKDVESAEYTRPGRKITVKAARFADASGAYGAFTLYKEPDMTTLDMGAKPGESLGASLENRVLFYRSNVLVQVQLDRVTAMTAGELRELASLLPEAQGPAKNLPILPTYLPRQAYVKNSAKYVIGPVGLARAGSPIPEQVVGFEQGAEVVIGKYNTSGGTATLMLISYPTPAIAGEHLRNIGALNQNPPANSNPELAPPIEAKRTGPMVVLTAGRIPSSEAKSLLASVNYDADVTWNENTYFDKRNNVGSFLVNLIGLIGILLLLALGFGVAFGGLRLVMKKWFPGRVFDRSEDMDIIQLRIGK